MKFLSRLKIRSPTLPFSLSAIFHVMNKKPPRYRIDRNPFGRWFIVNARDPELAWSGSCWVEHEAGVSRGKAHVTYFFSQEAAEIYAREIWGE